MTKAMAMFRIRPRPEQPEYYQVRIFRRQSDMLEWGKEHSLLDVDDNEFALPTDKDTGAYVTHAHFYNYDEDGNEIKLPQLGYICFHLEEFGSGIVSHEMTHAALYWFKAYVGQYSELDKDEQIENLCWVQGWMVKEFWRHHKRLHKRGRV